MMKRNWIAPALIFSGFGLLSACSTPASPSHAATPSTDPARPSWATTDHLVGRVDAGQPISVQVHLALRNSDAALAELAAISDPDSAQYGQFLSDDDFNAKYAPTADDVAAVRAFVEKAGLRVTNVPANNTYIAAVGPASSVERAFATHLGLYKVNDEVRRAAMETLSMPSEIAARVSAVIGVSTPPMVKSRVTKVGGLSSRDFVHKVKPNDAGAPGVCSEWFGEFPDTTDPIYPGYSPLTFLPCGYKPAQIREAYGFSTSIRKGNDGTGQTIAIVDAWLSPTLLTDAQTYAANNDPDYPLAASQLVTVWAPGTATPADTGWYGEQTLDVEAAHAMAPGATIVAVAAQSSSDDDLMAAENLVVEKRLGSVISNSWGGTENDGTDYLAWKGIFTQAGLKGIGVYFSSGDAGDNSVGFFGPQPPVADFPASSDLVTAVGGTSLALDRFGATTWELGWETSASFLDPAVVTDGGTTPAMWDPAPPGSYIFGAGGGFSVIFEQPKWQKGVVPNAYAVQKNVARRTIPDVAMLADPLTGFIIGQTDPNSGVYGESGIGGTSLACPLFAATVTLAQQKSGHKLGQANALFYKQRKTAFRDIAPSAIPQALAVPTSSGNAAAPVDYQGLTIKSAVGWDSVTGLGVPSGAGFLKSIK